MRMAATRSGLSACIIAFNEADRIEACVRSVSFCDEVIVVDSHSTDATRELAAARVAGAAGAQRICAPAVRHGKGAGSP